MRSKKALKNIVVSVIMQIIAVFYGFIVPRLIIKQYGSEVNGLLSSIIQFLGYITLLEAGFGPVVKAALYKPLANKNLQEIANIIKASEKFFKKIAIIFLIYILILTIIYPLYINSSFDFFFTSSLVLIIAAATFAEYFFGISYQLLLQANQSAYITAGIQATIYVLSIIATLICVKLNLDIRILKALLCGLCLFKPIILNIYVRKKFKLKEQKTDETFKLKNKWDGLAQHIAAVINDKTDVVTLTIFAGLKSVSVYSIYYLVTHSINTLIESISSSISATFGDIIVKKESDILEKKYNSYESAYLTLITILYAAAICLIIPFIATYTSGINDADYVQPIFALIFVLSGLAFAIRLPYNGITLAAGKFKETRNGAILEATLNVVISILCVIKLGLIGVAIGTLIAQTVRTIEFIYFTNKQIIHRSTKTTISKITLLFVEIAISFTLSKIIPYNGNGYIDLVFYAFKIMLPSSLLILLINISVYKKDFKEIIKILRKDREAK